MELTTQKPHGNIGKKKEKLSFDFCGYLPA
jgi:hypothetical protein